MEINHAINILAEHVMIKGLAPDFRVKAQDISPSISINDLNELRKHLPYLPYLLISLEF